MLRDNSASCRVLVLNCEKIYPQYILSSTIFPFKRTQLTPYLDLFSPLVIFWIYLQSKSKSSKDGFGVCLFQSFTTQPSYIVHYSEILVTIVLHCDIFIITRIQLNQKRKGQKIRCEHIKQGGGGEQYHVHWIITHTVQQSQNVQHVAYKQLSKQWVCLCE